MTNTALPVIEPTYTIEQVAQMANRSYASVNRDIRDKKLSKTAQVRMVGNSVCPPLAEALVRANFAHEQTIYNVA